MPFEFVFFNYGLQTLIRHLLLTLSYGFFIFSGISFKKEQEDFHLTNMMIFIGTSLLAWYIIRFFVPDLRVIDSLTLLEIRQGFIYDFTMSESITDNLHILLGISLILFGRSNRKFDGVYGILAGLFMLAGFSLLLTSNYYYYYLAWFIDWKDPVPLSSYTKIFNTIILISVLIILLALLLILLYSLKIKQKYLTLYGILQFVTYLWVIILIYR